VNSGRPEPFTPEVLREYDVQEVVGLTLSADRQSVCYVVVFEGRKDKRRRKMVCSKRDMRMVDERFSKQYRLKCLLAYLKRKSGGD
jgi:hypothetical protein